MRGVRHWCRSIQGTALMLCLLLFGCEETFDPDADLHEAQRAVQHYDWSYAERCFVRYLREVEAPEKRWQAWQGLLRIVTRPGYMDRRAALDYLETMAVEYNEDYEKMRELLPQMAELAEAARKYDRALELWDEYIQLPELSEKEFLSGHRHLALIYMRLGRYAAAEDILQDAFSMAQSPEARAQFLYALADSNVAREQWQEAVDLGVQALELAEEPVLRASVQFLLGDALEQLKRLDEALKYFVQALKAYPNTLAVDNRIVILKKKMARR